MTADQYVDLVFEVKTNIETKFTELLAPATQIEGRIITARTDGDSGWVGALQNDDGKIRKLFILMNEFRDSELEKIAGAKNFKPQIRFGLELVHEHVIGTDADNSHREFLRACIKAQFVCATNRNLHSKAFIESYYLTAGIHPSRVQSLHYARGEVRINFREVRY